MKKKLARRWLNRNKWRIAKFNLGYFDTGTQFHKQYLNCKRAQRTPGHYDPGISEYRMAEIQSYLQKRRTAVCQLWNTPPDKKSCLGV